MHRRIDIAHEGIGWLRSRRKRFGGDFEIVDRESGVFQFGVVAENRFLSRDPAQLASFRIEMESEIAEEEVEGARRGATMRPEHRR
jgi:hypothetical protein